jgi:thymidylate synthase (FAD)
MVDNYFMPKCELVGYCTEKKCCGRKPYKEI